uniref:FLYWCH-type domain-containing protein n=1 Tax=Glossina brevipalpis TaxID=37001 RepID=A0A1A9WMN2_9MUSC
MIVETFTNIKYIYSQRGRPEIVLNNYLYRKNREKYWRCLRFSQHKCRASLIIDANRVRVYRDHNHEDETKTLKEYVKLDSKVEFIYSQRGYPLIAYRNYLYCKNRRRSWRCVHFTRGKCKAHLLYFNDHYVQIIDYKELLKKPEPYSLPFPIGVWLENPTLYFMLNQKQGYNLIFHGYMYKKEASFRSTVNWICSNGNGKRASDNKCTARCITKMEGSLKLGKNPHNHPPKFTENSLPANLLKAEGLLPIRF